MPLRNERNGQGLGGGQAAPLLAGRPDEVAEYIAVGPEGDHQHGTGVRAPAASVVARRRIDGRRERRQEERARQPEDDPGCQSQPRGKAIPVVRAVVRPTPCARSATAIAPLVRSGRCARREGHRPAQFGATGTTSTGGDQRGRMPSAAAIEAAAAPSSQMVAKAIHATRHATLRLPPESANAPSACPRCVRAVRLRVVMAASTATPVIAIRTNTGQSGSAPAIEPTTTSSASNECARDADHRQRAARAPEPILAVERIARTAPDARRRRAARARTS